MITLSNTQILIILNDEERFIMLGMSAALRILVVCYCYREDESTIRIISSRKATKKETHYYGGDKR
jgi:uncharacterized DUF497 family protein